MTPVAHARALARGLGLALWTAALYAVFSLTRSHRLQHTWARGVLRVLGGRARVRGAPPAAPFVLVANHVSYVDIVALLACAPCTFVAKSEVAGWPLIGRLAQSTGHLFVQRERRGDLPRVVREIETRLAAGEGVAIFAEGTSSPGERVLPFHSSFFAGPARSGRPVHCASLCYTTPPGAAPAHLAIGWWGDMTLGDHLYRLLGLPRFEVAVTFAEKPVEGPDRKDLARRARARVESCFTPTLSRA